jgi:drug/metabolite transporter (DMT)-like permease
MIINAATLAVISRAPVWGVVNEGIMTKAISHAVPTTAVRAAAKQKGAVLMLLAAAFFWGSGNVANKSVLQDLDPFAAATLRNLVAAVVLVPFAWREFGGVSRPGAWLRSALVPSGLFAAAIILQQWGYQSATVTNASFLVNAASVVTPIIAYFVLKERLHGSIGVAAILTLIGAFLMSGAGRSLSVMNAGDIACLVSAVFYGGWMVALSRHAVRYDSPAATTCLHCLMAVALAGGIVVVFAPDQPGTVAGGMAELLYLGIVSSALAFGLTAAAQAHVSASAAAVLVAAESLFGAAGGILVLGERPGAIAVCGAGLMLVAILIVARLPAPMPRRVAHLT